MAKIVLYRKPAPVNQTLLPAFLPYSVASNAREARVRAGSTATMRPRITMDDGLKEESKAVFSWLDGLLISEYFR
ncbi:MAG: hypothetical protein ACLFV5_02400 [Anaerolineales bacterium]